jgi:N-acetylglucosamine kinase-like BadF-type ATPase
MILVADSGSTKTDWFVTDGIRVHKEFRTSGVNPMVQDKEEVHYQLIKIQEHLEDIPVTRIHFFGAGCSEDAGKAVVKDSFVSFFSNPEIKVENDLMGAAISLFGRSPGIACILGTGSNCCSYDGQTITDARHGIGYVLGDEASGAYFGKLIIRDYLYGRLEKELVDAIDERYGLSRGQILEKVYKAANPNRFLAGFSAILSEHLNSDYVSGMIRQGVDEFIDLNILTYTGTKSQSVGFCGSVAYAFREIISERIENAELILGPILQRPIDGLMKFYTSGDQIITEEGT